MIFWYIYKQKNESVLFCSISKSCYHNTKKLNIVGKEISISNKRAVANASALLFVHLILLGILRNRRHHDFHPYTKAQAHC